MRRKTILDGFDNQRVREDAVASTHVSFWRVDSAGQGRWCAALLCALSVACCRSPRTQIVVAIDTDYPVPSIVGSLRVRVHDPRNGGTTVQPIVLSGTGSTGCVDQRDSARFCVPLSLLLVPTPGRGDDQPAEITVEAVRGTDPVSGATLVSQTARLRFIAGYTLRLPMFLRRDCEGVFCPTDFTCGEGARCYSIDQPSGVVRVDPVSGTPLDGSVLDGSAPDSVAPLDVAMRDGSLDSGVAVMDVAVDAATDAALDAATDVVVADSGEIALCDPRGCPPVQQLVTGHDFSCARLTTGQVTCWGANDKGQLGRGTLTPRMPDGSLGLHNAAFVLGVESSSLVAAGYEHACATSGPAGSQRLLCWGANPNRAMIPTAMGDSVSTPEAVTLPVVAAPTALALGRESSYAQVGRDLFAWGTNADSALGIGATAPAVAPARLASAADLSDPVARRRGACVHAEARTRCFGFNTGHRFGAISAAGELVPFPTAISPSLATADFSFSSSFACRASGADSRCWGEHRPSGVLGRFPVMGDPSTYTSPQRVAVGAPIASIALGDDFGLALGRNGLVYCWGSNAEGACAFGTQATSGEVSPPRTLVRSIEFPRAFTAPCRTIHAGAGHACAVDSANVVWCWGRNANGQAGQRVTMDPRSRAIVTPRPVILPRPM